MGMTKLIKAINGENTSHSPYQCYAALLFLPVIGADPVEGSVELRDVGSEQDVVPHGQLESVDVVHHAVSTQQ